MTENFYAVIMAGGGGTRLWPLSRQKHPKQMLPLIAERTLFQIAVHRLSNLFPPERIFVVTNEEHSVELRKQCPEIQEQNFLLEPEPRGTAAAIGLAAAHLNQSDPSSIMAVLTADHYIGNEDSFLDYLREAKEIAVQGHLVTLGIDPAYPATQYGYIQQGDKLDVSGLSPAFEVNRFKEKPDESEAKGMLAAGGHSWNSGMFIWQTARILEEFERQMPALHRSLLIISEPSTPQNLRREEWLKQETETIDYGIMEHAQNVSVIPAKDLQWNDVGSWSSLFEVLEPDADGNVIISKNSHNLGSRNSLVHSDDKTKMIVTVGVEDLVIVDAGDVLLICSKENAQDVRKVIELLKEKGSTDYL
jgi:mannose-1-phosphate guanylyltransferase